MNLNLKQLITDFINTINPNNVNDILYNEFGLQLALAIYLKQRTEIINGNYKVQIERNVGYFTQNKKGFVKKEIDIVFFNDNERYAIELKCPKNGQYPEQMYSFIKDLVFVKQLKDKNSGAKFNDAVCLTIVDDSHFYESSDRNSKNSILYNIFRVGCDNTIEIPSGSFSKPTGKQPQDNNSIELDSNISTKWVYLQNIGNAYYIAG